MMKGWWNVLPSWVVHRYHDLFYHPWPFMVWFNCFCRFTKSPSPANWFTVTLYFRNGEMFYARVGSIAVRTLKRRLNLILICDADCIMKGILPVRVSNTHLFRNEFGFICSTHQNTGESQQKQLIIVSVGIHQVSSVSSSSAKWYLTQCPSLLSTLTTFLLPVTDFMTNDKRKCLDGLLLPFVTEKIAKI